VFWFCEGSNFGIFPIPRWSPYGAGTTVQPLMWTVFTNIVYSFIVCFDLLLGQCSCLRSDLLCVEWDVKYYQIMWPVSIHEALKKQFLRTCHFHMWHIAEVLYVSLWVCDTSAASFLIEFFFQYVIVISQILSSQTFLTSVSVAPLVFKSQIYTND